MGRPAYPFLAEGGLGSEGFFVGQDLYSGSSFVYDPWILYARGLITAPNLVARRHRRLWQILVGDGISMDT